MSASLSTELRNKHGVSVTNSSQHLAAGSLALQAVE